MARLAVELQVAGAVIESRVLLVDRAVRIGSAEGAVVHFPGADLWVVPAGAQVWIGGRCLKQGQVRLLACDGVRVRIEHLGTAPRRRAWAAALDPRFAAAFMVLLAAIAVHDAQQAWWRSAAVQRLEWGAPIARVDRGDAQSAQPPRASTLRSLLQPPAAERMGAPPIADGPPHVPDDQASGVAWAPWYRAAVPTDWARVDAAHARLRILPADAAARRVVAQAAYAADDFETAAAQYLWIVQRNPDDRDARLRRALAWQREGRHRSALALYSQLVAGDARHGRGLAGHAVAQAGVAQWIPAPRCGYVLVF